MSDAHLSTANYAAVIADLRAKRDELDRTIAMLETMARLDSPQPSRPTSERLAPLVNALFDKGSHAVQEWHSSTGIGEACALVLKASGRIMSTREVTDALTRSGFNFRQVQNPVNNVWSALDNRTKKARDVVRDGRDWRYVSSSAAAQRPNGAAAPSYMAE